MRTVCNKAQGEKSAMKYIPFLLSAIMLAAGVAGYILMLVVAKPRQSVNH